jgi:hypothetical protein
MAVLVFTACSDMSEPLGPPASQTQVQLSHVSPRAQEALREVMALQQTVFGGYDASGELVVGVEHAGVSNGLARVLERFGVEDYRVEITEPIRFASDNLRSTHRPTKAGIQIHWSNFVCTLGFNVDHAGGRSFITNSHCTEQQGTTGSTAYYQPSSSAEPNAIAIEAHDPSYFRGGACSRGKVCRYSDSSRALYQTGIDSNGEIARTTGVNNGDLSVTGVFDITSQDNSSTTFSGTVNKVGRTTGWTAGNVTNTCVTVNVSGSNIQLLCQTIVENANAVIVQGGDSGSPVFTTSGGGAHLVGILWGGNSSGSLFVFSPLKSIQDELGTVDATTDGTGDGDGGGDDCTPRGKSGNCH